jgi:pimeloyl-ACP methyl ester carboxylesterase
MDRLATHSPSSIAFADLPANAERGPLRLEYQWLNPERVDAPVAVFLHEGLGSIAMWKDWPRTLCDTLGFRGLVYSRPGYGASTPRPHNVKLPVDFMHRQAVDVLPAFLDALGIDATEPERMWLVGHSDGGSIVLLYAAAFPKALAGVIVVAPHVIVEQKSVDAIAEAKVAYETTDLRDKLKRYHDDVDSAFYGWNDIWLNPEFRRWDITGLLASIECPLLAVQGNDDEYGTMAQIDLIQQHVDHAQLIKLSDCGHSPHRQAGPLLNDEIAAFISEL